ncbi:MAG: alcohol dehydrogenase catalytic domain-containing protein [Pirellulales bacterium]|nr:alcohol dehydrogenase catalytic domain-containing protein [Pirellulales bacterium]
MSEKRIHDGFVENVRIRYRLGAWDRDKQFNICFLQSYPRLVREMPPKSQNMKALLSPEFDTLQLCEQSVPEPAADEVLLRVSACGICGSELESFQTRSPRRPPPLVMGHEFCGVIERLGEAVEGWAPGDRVVSNSVVPCDNCPLCSRGDTHLRYSECTASGRSQNGRMSLRAVCSPGQTIYPLRLLAWLSRLATGCTS